MRSGAQNFDALSVIKFNLNFTTLNPGVHATAKAAL